MRLAVLSDVHANLPALEAVIADARSLGAEGFVVLGDLADRGPFPEATVERLKALETPWAITGNTDLGLVRMAQAPPKAWQVEARFAPLRWTAARLEPSSVAFLSRLPATLSLQLEGCDAVRLAHGTPRSCSEGIFPERGKAGVDAALDGVEEPVHLCGHTHRQWAVERGARLAVNPGSVGISFGAEGAAQYALLDSRVGRWECELRSVAYDRDRTLRAFVESGFLDACGYFGRAAFLSVKHGEDVMAAFLAHLQAVLERRGESNVSEDAWEEAGSTMDWVSD